MAVRGVYLGGMEKGGETSPAVGVREYDGMACPGIGQPLLHGPINGPDAQGLALAFADVGGMRTGSQGGGDIRVADEGEGAESKVDKTLAAEVRFHEALDPRLVKPRLSHPRQECRHPADAVRCGAPRRLDLFRGVADRQLRRFPLQQDRVHDLLDSALPMGASDGRKPKSDSARPMATSVTVTVLPATDARTASRNAPAASAGDDAPSAPTTCQADQEP